MIVCYQIDPRCKVQYLLMIFLSFDIDYVCNKMVSSCQSNCSPLQCMLAHFQIDLRSTAQCLYMIFQSFHIHCVCNVMVSSCQNNHSLLQWMIVHFQIDLWCTVQFLYMIFFVVAHWLYFQCNGFIIPYKIAKN